MILRPQLRPPPICLFCIQTSHPPRIAPIRRSPFSTTSRFHNEFPNHYETLGLTPSATQSEIKKQFYALSKKHHPDLNPNDPHASKTFVKISEAYHVLGSESNRQKYDRDYHRAHSPSSAAGYTTPKGSHSSHSASGPAGSRPASGLSRRRGTFRGPPPSFYEQGAYGAQGAKRAAASAEAAAGGGFSAGQHPPDYDDDPNMPYWDKAGHLRTHEGLGTRREQAKRRSARRWAEAEAMEAGGSMLFNFLVVSGIVCLIGTVPMVLLAVTKEKPERRREKRGDG